MEITPAVVLEYSKWQRQERPEGEGLHWVYDHDKFLSIRATHSDMDGHIAPDEGWVLEIYPVEGWQSQPGDYDDIRRYYPDSIEEVKRMAKGLILSESIVRA